ncbi:hypothetical protein HMPREF0262_03414 [Clostridium sp. ATCC 29733]|nr:hypothetical protein HMPREF0262_03414 [Clostridium sp. ATCC 29733]
MQKINISLFYHLPPPGASFPAAPVAPGPVPGVTTTIYKKKYPLFSRRAPFGGINAPLFSDPIASGTAADPSVKKRLSRSAFRQTGRTAPPPLFDKINLG